MTVRWWWFGAPRGRDLRRCARAAGGAARVGQEPPRRSGMRSQPHPPVRKATFRRPWTTGVVVSAWLGPFFGPGLGPLLGPFLGLALLAGCASSPPSYFYTLTPLPETRDRTGDIDGGAIALGIGPVVFPQFLDRPQIVTRDGANRLALDEFRRWGGTVQDDFLRVWGENLAHLLNTSRILVFPSESRMPLDFRITAEVVGFEGTDDTEALLRVRWAVMDSYLEQTLAMREDSYRCPIVSQPQLVTGDAASPGSTRATDGPDTAALVAALSRCLGEFSRDVAAVVRALPRPLPPPATVTPM